jgi:predicted metal-dependent HD superfamily phosphohydrolase
MITYGTDPLWRWFDVLKLANNRFDEISIDFNFTNLIYTEHILKQYTNTSRYYHNLGHIEYMLVHIKEAEYSISHKNKVLLKLAIWFHDIIYIPGHSKNEEYSAMKLESFAQALGFKDEDIEVMKWLIILTKHTGYPQTYLEDVICDLDLRELGTDRYEQYSIKIRKEFSMLDDKQWNKGRIEFLEFMLDKEYIYHTDLYREMFENKARDNMQKEIESIKQKYNGERNTAVYDGNG